LHSSKDDIRKHLVPSTRHTTVELRQGLIDALASRRSLSSRTIMIACTLIDGLNDSLDDARDLANFLRPVLDIAPKIAIDLIPYNDIGTDLTDGLTRPSSERIQIFQTVLREEGYYVAVRHTRGDDEAAACGMLTTNRKKVQRTRSDDR